ncbi:MAG TPA: hypothetical protein VH834_12140 [Solirubrobacteraceae bacterium]
MKACRLSLALLAALLALPAAAPAAPVPDPGCDAIVAPRAAIELPVRVAPGLTVRVRDPYGGLIARNRLFVAFSIRYARPADRARVASVTWLLDGQPPRRDEGGRDQLLAPSKMYAPGPHVIGVRIAPAGGGAPVEAELQVTATNCQLASITPGVARPGAMTLDVASGGPVLRAVELVPARGRFAVPRGGRLGTATIGGRARVLRSGALDRRHRTLRIGRLPEGTTSVRVRLRRGVAPGRACAMAATLEGGSGAPVRVVARC